MAQLTSLERQKLLLQQEIAKLSGAISRRDVSSSSQSTSSTTYNPNSSYNSAYSRPSSSYHPYRPSSTYGPTATRKGFVGSGTVKLDLRAANKAAAQKKALNAQKPFSCSESVATDSPGTIVQLSEQKQADDDREEGEVSPSPSPRNASPEKQPEPVKKQPSAQNYVRFGNSLMTKETSDKIVANALKRKNRAPAVHILRSSSAVNAKIVTIDGVAFQYEAGGRKLRRLAAPASTGGGPSTPTRKKLEFEGKSYIRTNKGNLIPIRKSRPDRKQIYCRFFTKTGRCDYAHICPFIHSPSHRSICPPFLRGRCSETAETCRLSHQISTHNTPSCQRFQQFSTCSVPNCPYPHIKVAKDAEVCQAFADGGWCPKEEGQCGALHVWECQEWRATGRCRRGAACTLRHVLKAETMPGTKGSVKLIKDLKGTQEASGAGAVVSAPVNTGEEGGFEDGSSWIGVPSLAGDWDLEQGAPAPISDVEQELDEDGDVVASQGEEASDGESDDGDDSSVSDDEDVARGEVDIDNRHTTEEASQLNVISASEEIVPVDRTEEEEDDGMSTDEADEEEVLGVIL